METILRFWKSKNARSIHSRRGQNTYRPADIPPNATTFTYMPLTDSVVELLEHGVVTGTFKLTSNIPGVADVVPTEAHVAKSREWLETQDDDILQPVGGEHTDHGETVPRKDVVQVPPVDSGDARLERSEEHRTEISTDGVQRVDAGSVPVENRPVEGVGTVPPAVQVPGRDELQQREVRPDAGTKPVSSEPVQRREERGHEAGGVGHTVYRWQQ